MDIQHLIAAAERIYGFSPLEKSRRLECVWGRYAIFSVLRNEGRTLGYIGSHFNKNHASVLKGIEKHYIYYGVDKEYTAMYNAFLQEIEAQAA